MILVVGDQKDALSWVVKNAVKRSQLVILTGGLGPTEDDRTREAVAEALGLELEYREELVEQIRQRFARQRLEMPPINARQGFVIHGAEVLPNERGTAPGQWLPLGHGGVLLLPGPRHEMEPLFEMVLRTIIAPQCNFSIYKRVLRCSGIGESDLDARISGIYMPEQRAVQTTVLASPGQVEVHLTGRSRKDPEEMQGLVDDLYARISGVLTDFVLDEELSTLPQQVIRYLERSGRTLAVAESCTAGGISRRLTEVPGASKVFCGGVVAYDNRLKVSLLGVEPSLLAEHGAVSRTCADAMARGVRLTCQADVGLAITGIAGPDGATPGKPVGLVFISLFGEGIDVSFHRVFPGDRNMVRLRAEMAALDLLRQHLR
jgi:nicotinamide-nucleotide amidase